MRCAPARIPLRIAALALLAAAAISCRPELIVGVATRVHPDGSLDRRVEVEGRTDKGEAPEDPDWLAAEAGLALADPEAWGRIQRAPGRLIAEGFFLSADALPPLLVHATGQGARADRVRTVLDIDERVVLERWVYRQHHGDVYGAGERDAAIDALIELAAEALGSEIAAELGESVDFAPAREWLRNEGRSLLSALMSADRQAPGWKRVEKRNELWSRVLSQHGAPVAAVDEPEAFWDTQVPLLLRWSRAEVARRLSTAQRPLGEDELGFWPTGDDAEEQTTRIVERVWGDADEFQERVEPLLAALVGFYGGDEAPRTRFEIRVTLPGMLLSTNGTPEADGAVWLLREEDVSFGERVLRAESVELRDEALRRLGARRQFQLNEIVRLADLLWTRDPEGLLAGLLRRAVERGNLDLLGAPDELPAELHPEARELQTLLRGPTGSDHTF